MMLNVFATEWEHSQSTLSVVAQARSRMCPDNNFVENEEALAQHLDHKLLRSDEFRNQLETCLTRTMSRESHS